MITTANLPDKPCLLCKELFHPWIPFNRCLMSKEEREKEPTWEWWFCEKCIDRAKKEIPKKAPEEEVSK